MILAAGCTSPEQSELDRATSLWRDADISHYRFQSQRGCECVPEVYSPVTIEVVDDAIVDIRYVDSGDPVDPMYLGAFYTIDGLFDVIQEAIDDGAQSIDAVYDPQFGLPLEISIDYELNIADEEFYVDVTDFESLDAGS